MKEKEINIESLIKLLTLLQQGGCKTAHITGTLICKESGNTIIASSEKQM